MPCSDKRLRPPDPINREAAWLIKSRLPSTSASFDALIKSDYVRRAKVVRDAGIRMK